MDIKEYINKAVETIKNDPALLKQFKTEPVKAIEKVLGVDLPDQMLEGVVAGVKAKISADSISDAVGSLKNLFGK